MTVTGENATQWTRVCSLDQLIPERGIAALVGMEPVAVFLLDDGTVHAVGHRDPFSGANVMARGIIGSMGAGEDCRDTVASPMYKQVFDLVTGECLSEPGARLPVHPVRIVDGHVKAAMQKVLEEIRSGEFAREWIAENEAGQPRYRELLQQDLNHPIERVGRTLRERMAWLKRQAAA